MNKKDREDLEAVKSMLTDQNLSRFSQLEEVKDQLKDIEKKNEDAHEALTTSIDKINKGLLDPHKGLWAETKANSRFVNGMSKALWIIVPILVLGLISTAFDVYTMVKATPIIP